jgi:TIR domain
VPLIPQDCFRIFISHKHQDHALAMTVRLALERLTERSERKISCFVSGADITAGHDWDRQIRRELANSHLLILLFTNPSRDWDWCLFETGLFTRFDADDVHAVVCLVGEGQTQPRPLARLQSVPAKGDKLERFLEQLCLETWQVSDDWRLGPLAPRVEPELLKAAAEEIASSFPDSGTESADVYPCHRVVLDLDVPEIDLHQGRIPEAALVVVDGNNATSALTLALFNFVSGPRRRTWGDLLRSLDAVDSEWRHQLDRRFHATIDEKLFTPMTATLRAWDPGHRQQRIFKPVLYRVHRTPAPRGNGSPDCHPRPVGVTIVFDPQLAPSRVGGPEFNLVRIHARFDMEVFDEYAGKVRERGAAVCSDIREALRLIYEEVEKYGLFDEQELRRVYGDDYKSTRLSTLGDRWTAALDELYAALSREDLDTVDALLTEMRAMSRQFSIIATARYLEVLYRG